MLLEYFDAQFGGKVEFRFDVSDVVTLPGTRKDYGANDESGQDNAPAMMIIDACRLADADIDFSMYDDDSDGEIDNVFVFFAGEDEAEGADEECIWSHAWYIYNGAGYNMSLDGKRLNRYACTSELTRLTVADGKVLFAKGPEEEGVILTKGMGATIEEGAEMPVVEEVADINSIAWQRGSFIFDQTPLKDVLDCLSKYYHVSFVATDLSKRLSGEFYADDLDLIIELIESALDVTIIKR